MAKDYMVRAVAADSQIRAFAVTSRDLVEYARKQHGTSPVATAALGRTLSAALMMSDMLKGDKDALSIIFEGDGPIKKVVATADSHGNVKGYVENPLVLLPLKPDGHFDVGGAVGKGTLTVVRDLDMKNTYNGQVAIHSGEIADDLTHYFAESEQIPSSVGLGVLTDRFANYHVTAAGGFIIQLMPFATEETVAKLEESLRDVPFVTDMLSDGETPETMLKTVLRGFDVKITETVPVQFHCDCSRKRYAKAIRLLGMRQLMSLIDDNKTQEIVCGFCAKKYYFSNRDLRAIFSELMKEDASKNVIEKAAGECDNAPG